MGKKKKMHRRPVFARWRSWVAATFPLAGLFIVSPTRIKVTKTLVEKPARRASSVDRFAEPSQKSSVTLLGVSANMGLGNVDSM